VDAALREHLGITDAQPVSGGCIHRCYRVRRSGRVRFLKVNDRQLADAFAAEADGLMALRDGGARAPEAIAHGEIGGNAYLLLEYLEFSSRGDYASLGRMLAGVHRRLGERYGWRRDNYIGSTPQPNGVCGSWQEFWRTQRLEPQLELARRNGHRLDDVPVWQLLAGHEPEASLVHGDLWSGNARFLAGGMPVVFDPAVYYGDREVDLAMTELFGGFPKEFYAAYNEVWPLTRDYERRKALYNLYHLLNHLNLFGGGYLEQVRTVLRLLAGAL
jgi:protein-ribulosamine 3-kinase